MVRWKLWMGVVRPNLLRFATETDPKQVTPESSLVHAHRLVMSFPQARACSYEYSHIWYVF